MMKTDKTPKVEMLLQKSKLVADTDQTVEMLIRITPPELPPSDRPRLNFGIVLDRSGSMGGEKMANAREAARYCINELIADDRISMVIFDDRIDVLIKNQPVTGKEQLKSLLNRIEARGSTALHEGWVKGGMEVSSSLIHGGINRVLLITDGQANVGVVNPDEIVSQARGLNARGISTSTIGIGDDFNEELLLPMAESGGGNAWHAQSPADLRRIFEVELKGLVAQFADAVSLGIIPADGVRIIDVLNEFALTETGRYSLPNLQAGSPLDIVVQLHVPARPAGTKLRLADVKVGYTPQGSSSAEVTKNFLELEYASAEEVQQLTVDESVVSAFALLMNAKARREAIHYMDEGQAELAQQVLHVRRKVATGHLNSMQAPDETLQKDTDDLDQLLEGFLLRSESSNRKQMRYAAYDSSRGRKQKP
jgi:Ca-activated chloride channel family protein